MITNSIKVLLVLSLCLPVLARGDEGTEQQDDQQKPSHQQNGAQFFDFQDEVFHTVPFRPRSSENYSPYNIDISVDLPIILTGYLIDRFPTMMGISIYQDVERLDPNRLNRLDRSVLGNWSEKADKASDVLRNTIWSLPFILDFFDVICSGSSDGLSGFSKDAIILLEVVAVKNIVTTLTKHAIHRPRPYAYNSNLSLSKRHDDNASLSFFSGHTSLSFAMATAYSYLFSKRHPDSPLVIPVWLGTHAVAASTAVLRVEAGKHFWSDVMVGAAVGSAIGYLVPYLHTMNDEGEGLTGNLLVVPLIYDGGFGVSATLVF